MALNITLDDWQKQVLNTEGNKVICSGRQVGKSTVIAIDAGEFAIKHPKKEVLIISAVERQAYWLFEKVLAYLTENYRKYIKTGKDKPTKTACKLKNGSIIRCLPTGLTGYGIRGLTIHRLYADEAAHIFQDVWHAVIPMLTTTGGDIILLSTPKGREGYFYDCYKDEENFTTFHINAEEVAESRPEPLKSNMQKLHALAKEQMTKREYEQEIQGLFIDDTNQFFSDHLIKSSMTASRGQVTSFLPVFLGVDVGGAGGDETTYQILQLRKDKLFHIDSIIEKGNLTTMTSRMVIHLDTKYDFKKIYVDDGGIGYGVFSELLEDPQTRRKTIAINNARRPLDKDERRKKKILKEDLYNNLLNLMEKGRIKLLDDPEIMQSLRSVQYSYEDGKFKIFGRYTHIAEGLIRAAWGIKEKIINTNIYWV